MDNSNQPGQVGLPVDFLSTVHQRYSIGQLDAEESLKAFILQAWHLVEPKKSLQWNWHLDVICEHLSAVTNSYIRHSGRKDKPVDYDLPTINYLWINVPPRHTKSLIVCVFWPIWEWGPMGLSELQYIFSSYAQELSTRDSLKRRRIIQSNWYQERWGHVFALAGDQNRKTRFENTETGYMMTSSVGGIGTGEGGDRIVVDDAHNIKDVESDVKREDALGWWDDTMSTRLNDERTGCYLGIMQRSHQHDLSGHVFEKAQKGEIDLDYICFPARYETDHPFLSKSKLHPQDPRTEPGEPLDKGRFDEENLSKLEKRMTAWRQSSQLQQRPTVRGGQVFKVSHIKIVDSYYTDHVMQQIRYWDKAATEGAGKRTAGVKIARMKSGGDYDFLIMDVVKGQWEYGARENRIKQVAQIDTITVQIYVEQEPGSGGKESVQNTLRHTLKGFTARADRATGDKFVRMEPLAAAVENDRVAVLKKLWTKDFLDEMENCGPGAAFVDQCDAASGGFNKLNEAKQAGIWGRSK